MDATMTCRSHDEESLATFRDGLATCFRAARQAGITSVHIMPHLDSGDGGDWSIRTWRNGLVFDPRERSGMRNASISDRGLSPARPTY